LGLPIPSELLEILPDIDHEGTRALQITVQGPPKYATLTLSSYTAVLPDWYPPNVWIGIVVLLNF